MSSVVADFDGTPRSFTGTTKIRLYDKSVATGTTVTQWRWNIGDVSGNWTTTYPASNNLLYYTNASTYWTIGDQVWITSTGSLPIGLSQTFYYIVAVTTYYLQISLTKGGTAAIWTSAGTGTHSIYHSSNKRNPIVTVRSGSTTSINIDLTAFGSDGTSDAETKTGFLNRVVSAPSKPTATGRHAEISIFIYDSSNAILLSREKTTNNPLFFGDLEIINQMNLAGLATFKVYNIGTELATTTDKGLLVSDKNIVILIGNNIVFSGKVWKCEQQSGSLYSDSAQYQVWSLECESDIVRMKNQAIKVENKVSYVYPVGYIVSKLVENNSSSDINWNGNSWDKGLISYEGPNYSYTIQDDDMYDQFTTLATVSGFDWRTRNNYVKYYYTSFGGGVITVATTAPYPANAFRYKWVLFLPPTGDIVSYGTCTSNTTTSITLGSIKNAGLPAATGHIIIIGDPVLDFSSDLRQNTPVATFTANAGPSDTLQNCYGVTEKSDFKNIATKVIAKGKSINEFIPGTKTPKTISIPLAAKDKFSDEDLQFENTAYITRKSEGYIICHGLSGGVVWIEGVNYSFQVGDLVHTFWNPDNLGVWGVWSRIVDGVNEYPNGTPFATSPYYPPKGTIATSISFAPLGGSYLQSPAISELSVSYVSNSKVYVNDISRVMRAGTYTNVYFGDETAPRIITNSLCGTNLVMGQYLYINANWNPGLPYGTGNTSTDMDAITSHPHRLGIPVSNDLYSESNPQTDSPLKTFGLITKSFSPDMSLAKRDLEIYVINSLLYNSYYYRKGILQTFVYDWYKSDIRPVNQYSGHTGWIMEGDQVAMLQVSGDTIDDVQYNQYKNRWQVISWKINCNQMIITANLGDFERNMFLLLNDKVASLTDAII